MQYRAKNKDFTLIGHFVILTRLQSSEKNPQNNHYIRSLAFECFNIALVHNNWGEHERAPH